MNSLIFKGLVEHRRVKPRPNSFRYKIYFYGIFLDELALLDKRLPLFGYNRFRPTSLHDRDYLDDSTATIENKLLRFLRREGCTVPISRILLITSARNWGRVFNPVSFYYCFDGAGEIVCMVAEVNNTFGERHLYVLSQPENGSDAPFLKYTAPKAFHVSPFNDMTGHYEFRFFQRPAEELDIRIDLHRDGEAVFNARLWGRPSSLTPWNHAWTLLRHPVIPHLTMPRILWQAARLHFGKGLQVYTKPNPRSLMTIRRIPPTPLQRKCMKAVTGMLDRVDTGRLDLVLPDGKTLTFGSSENGARAHLKVNDYRFFSRVALHGDIGFGDAFMQEDWDSDDPTALLELLIHNRDRLEDGNLTVSTASRALQTLRHWSRRNTIARTRRNIERHYDLSNDFFALFLDPSMTYSCALYNNDQETLEQAQRNKLEALIEKARIRSEDHVLEIGCGWGAFAIEAVKRTGCRVTGITVSRGQYEWASERVKHEGLLDRITILFQDYRHVTGSFDKIVSIEMLEAVGHEYFGMFFQCCERLLKPHGLVVLQAITIPDQRYDSYRRNSDWTQKHIFPGGILPSLLVLSRAMEKNSRLILEELKNIGPHYARTLAGWRANFLENEERIAQLGFDREFRRKWLYYLCYCEAAFSTRTLSDLQMVLTRPNNRSLGLLSKF